MGSRLLLLTVISSASDSEMKLSLVHGCESLDNDDYPEDESDNGLDLCKSVLSWGTHGA